MNLCSRFASMLFVSARDGLFPLGSRGSERFEFESLAEVIGLAQSGR